MGDFILPNGKPYYSKQRLTCDTEDVIYLMLCQCGQFYIGKTKRQFRRQVYDHVYAVRNGKTRTSISIHVGFKHNYNPIMMTFIGLEKVHKNPRGNDWG